MTKNIKNDRITVEKTLDYDFMTGEFRWRNRDRVHLKGEIVKRKPHKNGYLRVWLDGHYVLLSRAAWAWSTGERPKKEIDHINGKSVIIA
jgi:hypothetical protein